MAVGEYLTGLLFLAATTGAALGAAWIVVRRRLGSLGLVERLLAFGIVGSAAVILAHLVPGTLGVLDRWTAAVSALVLLAGSLLVPTTADRRVAPVGQRESLGAWAVAAPAILAVGTAVIASVRVGSSRAFDQVDWMSFTLPNVANWIHAGSFFNSTQFLPLFPVSAYPNNGDVLYLAAILPFHDDAFVRFVGVPVVAVIGLAAYALARELRAPASVAVLAAAVVLSLRAVTNPVLEGGKPDGFMLAACGAGLVFLVRHARTRERSDLLLGGLGLGLALGARWYGLSTAVVVVVVWAFAWLLARRPWRTLLREGGVLCGVIALAGGFWIVRNVIVLGNPIGTVPIAPFGITLFAGQPDPLRDLLGSSLASYLDNPRILHGYALPDYTAALGIPGAALAIALIAGVAVALVRWRRLSGTDALVLALGACAAGIAVAYAITPGSAQGFVGRPFPGLIGGNSRWLMPAAFPAAAVGAWALARAGRLRIVLELLAGVAVIDGLRRTFDLHAADYVSTALRLAVLALVIFGAVRLWRHLDVRAARLALVGAGTVVVLVGAVVYGQRTQHAFNATRYVGIEPTAEWVRTHAPEGHRIGLTGLWTAGSIPTAALYGPRLRNYVAYVGQGNGALRLPFNRRDPFLRALRRGHYDLLAVGLQKRSTADFRPSDLDVPIASLSAPSVPALRWAESAGYREVARGDRFVLVRRTGSG